MKTVTFIGQLHYFNCCIPDHLDGYEVKKINLDLQNLGMLTNMSSDVWVIFRPDFIAAGILKSLQGKKVWVSSEPIERDDVLGSYNRLRAHFNDWSLITHYDKTHLQSLSKIGVDAIEFQLPVNLELMSAEDESMEFFDIFFAGRSTVHREMLMGKLKRDYKFLHAAHGLIDDDFAFYASRSKICLNLNINSFPQLQHRMQNMIACGAFVLSEKQTHQDGLKAGLHYIQFNGEQDLIDKAEYYIEHPEEREKIASAGKKFVHENFNAETQWIQILTRLN